MNLPSLSDPAKYAGLYVFDFGEQVAVGYTAPEIEMLLESERYRNGKVYRIHRVSPDGTVELHGVSPVRFQMEDGLFFYRRSETEAAADFAALRRLAVTVPPPCRAQWQRSVLQHAATPHVNALIFPAECSDDVAAWLLHAGYAGGDYVEGGPSQVTGYYDAGPDVIEREQLWPAKDVPVRSREEVYATTHRVVQR